MILGLISKTIQSLSHWLHWIISVKSDFMNGGLVYIGQMAMILIRLIYVITFRELL